jgi:hypothetical protein
MKRLILSPIINLLFYGFAFAWIRNMEKNHCSCSQDWRREYMKYFFLSVMALQFVIMAKGVEVLHNYRIPLGIASIMYLMVSLSYIMDLKTHSCQCSKSLERSILFWYSVIQVFTMIILTWIMAKA